MGAETDKTELDKLRRQVSLLQEEMDNSLLATERKAQVARQEDRESNQVHAMLCHNIMYCTVQYCTVLYCTVLYCTVLYSCSASISKNCVKVTDAGVSALGAGCGHL